MAISFDAIGEKYVTFYAASGAEKGDVCKMTDNAEVGACSAGDDFCGIIESVRGSVASVLLGGFVELPYSGLTAPEVGFSTLVADGDGGVTVDEDGRSFLVVSVDTTAKTVGFCL